MEQLNVGSECLCSKLLTTNDFAVFLATSPIITTVIFEPEPNYNFNRFKQSRQLLLVQKILLVWLKPRKIDHLPR